MKIAVAGLGYVGLSVSLLLARHDEVAALDIDPAKVRALRDLRCPVKDEEAERLLCEARAGRERLLLEATTDAERAYGGADYVVIATPTDYDPQAQRFDTSCVESAIAAVRAHNQAAWVVIRSTVPIGYTDRLRERLDDQRLLFSPEFLREGHALHDNLHPSRVVVGSPAQDAARSAAQAFADLLVRGADPAERTRTNPDGTTGIPTLLTGCAEAEAVKLFSNAYLALRVAYFNELDTYCELRGLSSGDVIRAVCRDPRIGDFYNNPSFGYGGYCLPKDTRQLLASYEDVPQDLVEAIVASNRTRKDFVAGEVVRRAMARARQEGRPPVVGFYRLAMKTGSDNHRSSSVLGVIARVREAGLPVWVYEPTLDAPTVMGAKVTHDLAALKRECSVIVANRWDERLADVAGKVYTRDLFRRD